jgi:hypothetical protein
LSALKSSCLTPLPFSYITPRLKQPVPEGKGVKQDDSKAVKFYQKACDLNNGTGCSDLGFMYNAFAFFIHKSKIKATSAII